MRATILSGIKQRTMQKRIRSTVLRQSPGIIAAILVQVAGIIVGTSFTSYRDNFELPDVFRFESFPTYLFHNAPILLLLAVGALTGGLVTLLVLMSNGIVEGSVLAVAHSNGELSDALGAVLPHALFEIPAMTLASAVGFAPLSIIVRLSLKRTVYTKTELRDAVLLIAAAFALVIIAAMIEAWITPYVANSLR